MRSFRVFLLTGVFVLLIFLLFFFRGNIANFFERINIFGAGFFDRSFNYQFFQKLKLENESLKRELIETKEARPPLKDKFQYLEAEIYSRYPFNDQDLLVIDRGYEDGLREGLPVLVEKNIMIGKVKSVKRTQSEVETIFDSSWLSSVALGKDRINALFRGGGTPSIELIPKEADLALGDEILNLSKDYPLNISLGKIRDIKMDPSGVWQIGKVDLAYNPNTITKVLVILDFP